jgi:hypothetical protein
MYSIHFDVINKKRSEGERLNPRDDLEDYRVMSPGHHKKSWASLSIPFMLQISILGMHCVNII